MNGLFYVYIYLDPRKPGDFNYGEYHFDFEPLYTGKGKNNQIDKHLKEAKKENSKDSNLLKLNKIRKILSENLEPIRIKVKENLSESEAFELEKELIAAIGRYDLKIGPLTNLTDGGEGVSGHIFTEEQKKNLKLARKRRWENMSTEEKKKISDRMSGKNNPMFGKPGPRLGIKDSEETKKKKKEANIGEKNSMYGKKRTKEFIEAKRKLMKKRWEDPEFRERQLNVLKNIKREVTEDTKIKQSISHRGKIPWNKGKKGVQIQTEESNKKRSETMKKVHECNPELRNKSRIMKLGKKDSIITRKRKSESGKKAWEKRKNAVVKK